MIIDHLCKTIVYNLIKNVNTISNVVRIFPTFTCINKTNENIYSSSKNFSNHCIIKTNENVYNIHREINHLKSSTRMIFHYLHNIFREHRLPKDGITLLPPYGRERKG